MKKRFKLGVFCCDNNAINLIRGAVLSDFLSEKKICLGDLTEERFDEVADFGVTLTTDLKFVAENCEYLLFSGSRTVFGKIAEKIKGCEFKKVISVVPDFGKYSVKSALEADCHVARGILNLPSFIGSGMIGVDMSDYDAEVEDIEFVSKVFDSLGEVISVSEDKLAKIAALHNSVYPLVLIDSMIEAGLNVGLNKDEAKLVAVQTVLGAAEAVKREEQTLSELLMMTCKGSAAVEGFKVLEESDFKDAVINSVKASAARHSELVKK